MADRLRPPALTKKASPTAGAAPTAAASKLPHTLVRLNNNALESALPLYRVLDVVLLDVTALQWVDLSCNAITSIGGAFKRLPALKRLYLHSNLISMLSDLENLQANSGLEALTLHANPVTDKKNYRAFAVSTLPWLRSLDFSPITKRELDTALNWRKMTKVMTIAPAAGEAEA